MIYAKLDNLIYYWESKLDKQGVLIPKKIVPMVEDTLELLRELQSIKEKEVKP